jgi:hypothetical protein
MNVPSMCVCRPQEPMPSTRSANLNGPLVTLLPKKLPEFMALVNEPAQAARSQQ